MKPTAQQQSGEHSGTTILCATRGGPASYPAQDKAIELALDQHVDVVFLYVADAEFVGVVSSAVLVDMDAQMEELGEFVLLMAKERAEKAGVRAHTEVRSGRFRTALIEVAQEYDARAIVMGQPGESGLTDRVFLQEVGARLSEQIGVDVYIV